MEYKEEPYLESEWISFEKIVWYWGNPFWITILTYPPVAGIALACLAALQTNESSEYILLPNILPGFY